MNRQLYLDANAHVPMSSKTLEHYLEFSKSLGAHGHPSSPSTIGREAANAIAKARRKIASLIGAESSNNIVFTRSCTEACEWATSIAEALDRPVLASPIEHPAFKLPIENLSSVKSLAVSKNGVIDLSKYPSPPTVGTTVICIHTQNEIGTIQPIAEIKKRYPKSLVISDLSQSLGKVPCNVDELGVDIATFGAHKFGGPSGVGFMYLRNTDWWCEWGMGSRYFMDVVGTPDTVGISTTAVALEEAINTLEERRDKMIAFQQILEVGLSSMGFEIIGEGEERVPNTTFARVPTSNGLNGAGLLLMMALGKKGVHIGLGSACGSLHTGGSPLMQALNQPSDGQEYVRISQWGEYGAQDAEYVLKQIKECLPHDV